MTNYFLDIFVAPAFAETTTTTTPTSNYSLFLMMGFIVLFMYFAVIRPQNKRAKEMQTLISQLAEGDEILTSGGMMGKIAKIHEQYIILDIQEGHKICLQKNAVASVLPKGTLKSLMS